MENNHNDHFAIYIFPDLKVKYNETKTRGLHLAAGFHVTAFYTRRRHVDFTPTSGHGVVPNFSQSYEGCSSGFSAHSPSQLLGLRP